MCVQLLYYIKNLFSYFMNKNANFAGSSWKLFQPRIIAYVTQPEFYSIYTKLQGNVIKTALSTYIILC